MVVPFIGLLAAFQATTPIDSRANVPARIDALCPTIANMDRKALLAQERRLVVQDVSGARLRPGRSYSGPGWYMLGCLRAKLSFLDPAPQASWGIILPEPWANQALDVLISGLNRQPDHPEASALFAAVAIDATEYPANAVDVLYEDIALVLARAATGGVQNGAVLRGCARFQWAISDSATAQLCSRYALQAGVDSTWHLLRRAWIEMRHGDSVAAISHFDMARAAAHDSLSRAELSGTFGTALNTLTPTQLLKGVIASDGNLKMCPPNGVPACRAPYLNHGYDNIGLIANLNRLWNPIDGKPIGLVTYAMPRKDLVSPDAMEIVTAAASRAMLGGFMEPLPPLPNPRVFLLSRQWNNAGGLLSRGATIEVLGGGYQNMGDATGYLFVSSNERVIAWSVSASSPFGPASRRSMDELKPLDGGGLAVSDPILGTARDSVIWSTNGHKVFLAPRNAIYRSETAYLYYQVKTDSARAEMTTSIAFYALDRSDAASALLQVQFKSPTNPGLNEMQREMDVSRLEPGNYRIVIEVADAKRGEKSSQKTIVRVQ